VLQEIIEPFKAMQEQYCNVTLELGDESSLSGLVLAEDSTTSVTIQAEPAGEPNPKARQVRLPARALKASA
jgi:hypothetical protein